MEGFGGSTGVSKGYVDGAIAQSTAKLPQIIKSGNYWSNSLSEFGFESTSAHVGFSTDNDGRGFQIRIDTPDGNSIRLYLSATMGLLQRFEASSGWVTLKTLY